MNKEDALQKLKKRLQNDPVRENYRNIILDIMETAPCFYEKNENTGKKIKHLHIPYPAMVVNLKVALEEYEERYYPELFTGREPRKKLWNGPGFTNTLFTTEVPVIKLRED